jgi:hypothetical protein|tara:strand:- start:3711 stop:4142 length:432 start_codon:yes stop_codon:yes gene_type:complete
MKNFKSFLDESGIAGGGWDRSMALRTQNMAVYSDPTVIKKLNAWVGTIAGSYSLPEDAIHNMRTNLSKIGLSFDEVPMMEGESGSLELPLTSFGGRFGKGLSTPHDEFEVDDGISHQVEGGLKLVIGYEMQEDNSCRLSARIE